jgi:hypothetical protein
MLKLFEQMLHLHRTDTHKKEISFAQELWNLCLKRLELLYRYRVNTYLQYFAVIGQNNVRNFKVLGCTNITLAPTGSPMNKQI